MAGAIDVAGDVASAATAFSGLVLVFLGFMATAYDGFDSVSQEAVKSKYKKRAGIVLTGFFASLAASALAIGGKWLAHPELIATAASFLLLSLVVIGIAAWLTYADIGD